MMEKIKVDKIIRSRRRSISLIVTPEAALIVRAPFSVSSEYIDELVQKKISWIRRKIGEMRTRPVASRKKFVEGEELLFLGKKYKLRFIDGKKIKIEENCLLFPKSMILNIENKLINWYREQALRKISERTRLFSRFMGVDYSYVKISNAQKRWGSCGPKGSLNFAWRLIMAPLAIIDCVVVHELAHLIFRNHSRKFWNKVKEILPDYKIKTKWLVKNDLVMRI